VVQSIQDWNGHKPAARRFRFSQYRIGIPDPDPPLMNASAVIPDDELREDSSKMPFVPDRHSVQTLPAKCPYQPLDVRRRIGRPIRDRNSSNTHLTPEPRIVCRSTRYSLAAALRSNRSAEVTELSVVVVEQEFGLRFEAGVPDLLFRALKRWMIGARSLASRERAPRCSLSRPLKATSRQADPCLSVTASSTCA